MANLTPIIEQAFTQYAGAVLQSRALVDVRDGLKPSARQIFYCLYTDKFTHNKPFKKTLKAIGSASRMYIHGDSSAEGIIMRAGQPFAMRYPLIEVEGSFGNLMESGNWAAPRYTSARLTEFGEYMFNSINKNTISVWLDNYDATEQYPSVLPNIGVPGWINGTMGIGIGASSSIAPMNLKEVNHALIQIIKNPNISFDKIVCYPDFPTGATLLNRNEVKDSLQNGQGNSCKLRATITYQPEDNCLIVTEIPYMLYTNTICKELETIITENETTTFIERFNDLTGSTPLIKIYLKKGTNPKTAINYLYKNTSLESYYSINMTMLQDGKYPKVFGLRQIFDEYITHIRVCKRREIQFDLDKALARKNIVDGLIKAYSIIDEVVALIRSSSNPSEAASRLISTFDFNEEQAKAILAMKLSSLTKLDIVKLTEEQAELVEKIEWCNHLLNDSTALDAELIKILQEVADKFGDERRTKILDLVEETEESESEKINEENVAVMLFNNNMLRVVPTNEIQDGKRGRKGNNIKPPKNATLINTLYTTNLSTIAAFTDTGYMYNLSLTDLQYNEDYSIYDLTKLSTSEKVLLIIDTTSFNLYTNFITISKHGFIKKSDISEYNVCHKKGFAAVKLEENDKLVNVYLSSDDNDKILVVSSNGNYNFYPLNQVSSTGRVTKGVKAIKLIENECIQSSTIVKNNLQYKGILTISSNGKGKITPISDFSVTTRAIKGSQVMALKDDEHLATVYAVQENQEKLFISASNKAILLDILTIPLQNRMTNGVLIIDARNKNSTIEVI